MSDYLPTIGLEVHTELKTKTKMFCACLNNVDEKRPNVNICPVCTAHPGSLPVINKEAVQKVLLVGTSVGGTLANYTEFDRKSYFYPDIPKGYQISQYKNPLVLGGTLAGVALTRVHLEEDTARSQHTGGKSLVDFNRAGVPLMELVTEPCIHDARAAVEFAHELQLLLRALGAGDANMEKGEMRVEANISVTKDGPLGTKVEVKNLNSLRSVERSIAYEIERQKALLESGNAVEQETRGWDEIKNVTFLQRKKEKAHDYRYLPDPDLPELMLSEIQEFSHKQLKAQLPELPWEKRKRYLSLGLKKDDIEMFLSQPEYGVFFDSMECAVGEQSLLATNYIVSDIAGQREAGSVNDEWLRDKKNALRFKALMVLVQERKLSSRGAKNTLGAMFTDDREPATIARELGLMQESGREKILSIVETVVKDNAKVVNDYKNGKETALQYLLGQGMKASKGAANPTILEEIFLEILGE